MTVANSSSVLLLCRPVTRRRAGRHRRTASSGEAESRQSSARRSRTTNSEVRRPKRRSPCRFRDDRFSGDGFCVRVKGDGRRPPGLCSWQRDPQLPVGAGSGHRDQEKLPVAVCCHVAQDPQTEVTLFGVREQFGGRRTRHRVIDGKDGMSLRTLQTHRDAGRGRVPGDVAQTFLGDPIDESSPCGVQTGVRPISSATAVPLARRVVIRSVSAASSPNTIQLGVTAV